MTADTKLIQLLYYWRAHTSALIRRPDHALNNLVLWYASDRNTTHQSHACITDRLNWLDGCWPASDVTRRETFIVLRLACDGDEKNGRKEIQSNHLGSKYQTQPLLEWTMESDHCNLSNRTTSTRTKACRSETEINYTQVIIWHNKDPAPNKWSSNSEHPLKVHFLLAFPPSYSFSCREENLVENGGGLTWWLIRLVAGRFCKAEQITKKKRDGICYCVILSAANDIRII